MNANLQAVVRHFDYLVARWEDEHERWADYEKAMRKFLKQYGCVLLVMTVDRLSYRDGAKLVHIVVENDQLVAHVGTLQ